MANEGDGVSLGNAHGTITIDAQVDTAQAQLQAFATVARQQMAQLAVSASQVNAAFAGLSASATQAAQKVAPLQAATQAANTSFGTLNSTLRQVAGAFGLSLGIAGVVQLGKAAIAADELATAYNRQQVAAVNLAGSQSELNDLMEAYIEASGGAVDKVSALADVTKLMAVGFADSKQEISQFATAIRGISIAMGTSQDTVTQNLILELFSQRGQRLDQLGLEYSKVKQRSDELTASDKNLTSQMAYQQAVLEQAIERFGALTKSAEGQKSSLEKLQASLTDYQLALDQLIKTPVDVASSALSAYLKLAQTEFDAVSGAVERYIESLEHAYNVIAKVANAQTGIRLPSFTIGELPSLTPSAANGNAPRVPSGGVNPQQEEINNAVDDWFAKTRDIERQGNAARLSATQQFESQRTQAITQYEQTIARDAQDFGIQRAREERDFAQSIAQVHADTARQQVDQARELAETIANAQADSADRLADLQETNERNIAQKRADTSDKLAESQIDRDDDIAKRRVDSAKRIAGIEADYNTDREKAERDHRSRLFDAALDGDAKSLYEENRSFAREAQDKADARDKQIADEKSKLDDSIDEINDNYAKRVESEGKALQKSIDQANEAYARQVSDEKEALDKRIAQAQTAYDKQVADLKASDERRTADLQAAFAQRQSDEDADRALRLSRMATDHDAQLNELDNEQQKRIAQIDQQQKDQRDELDTKFKDQLYDMGKYTNAMKAHHDSLRDSATAAFDDWWKHVNEKLTATPINTDSPDRQLAGKRQELAELYKQEIGMDEGSPAWQALESRINALQQEIAALEKGGPTISSSSLLSPVPVAGSVMRTPSSAASGMRSVAVTFTQGAIAIYGAPGQSMEALAGIIDQRILRVVQMAAGSN